MKKTSLTLFFLSLLFTTALTSTIPTDAQQLFDKILVGKWTGKMGFMTRTSYEIEFKKSGSKYIGQAKTGSLITSFAAQLDEKGRLIITEDKLMAGRGRRRKDCKKKIQLKMVIRFDKKDIILKGRAEAKDCKIDYRIQLSKATSSRLFKSHAKEALAYLETGQMEVYDSDQNGQIDYSEPACIKQAINNPTLFTFEDALLSAYADFGNNSSRLLIQYSTSIGPKKKTSKSFFATVWEQQADVDMSISLGSVGDPVTIGSVKLPLSGQKAQSVQAATAFTFSDYYGLWQSRNKKVNLTFEPDGTFAYSINGRALKSGKWYVFTSYHCAKEERSDAIYFYDIKNLANEGGFLANARQAVYNVHQKAAIPNERLEIGRSKPTGGYVSHDFYRPQPEAPAAEEAAPTTQARFYEKSYKLADECETCIYCSSGYGGKRSYVKAVDVYCDDQLVETITIRNTEECIGHEGRSTSYKNYFSISGVFGRFSSDAEAMAYLRKRAGKYCK